MTHDGRRLCQTVQPLITVAPGIHGGLRRRHVLMREQDPGSRGISRQFEATAPQEKPVPSARAKAEARGSDKARGCAGQQSPELAFDSSCVHRIFEVSLPAQIPAAEARSGWPIRGRSRLLPLSRNRERHRPRLRKVLHLGLGEWAPSTPGTRCHSTGGSITQSRSGQEVEKSERCVGGRCQHPACVGFQKFVRGEPVES